MKRGEVVELGQIERTERAFRQDAWGAMRGDIVRALVEYITNADDAYARKGSGGKILLEVEHRRGTDPWYARVRDRATGMSLNELREKIGRQGGRSSGFAEGLSVRGNLGLGSKDPACFGKVSFETIKDAEYAYFEIDRNFKTRSSPRAAKATKEDRERLSIPNNANGTVVTIEVTQSGVICPRHDNLKHMLSNHILLRDIMQDGSREVLLVHANKPGAGAKSDRLSFQPPKLTTRVKKAAVPIPGYPGASADVLIEETDQPFQDEGRRSPTRRSGLLIKGRRAIYDCTLFAFDGNAYALAFTGFIRCEAIDRLANDFDEREDKGEQNPSENPMPIIDRRRDGLVEEHPFFSALKAVAEAELGPLVQERERRAKELSRAVENDRTTKLLSQLAREAAKFMREAAEEEEIDIPPGGPGAEAPPPLAIIPEMIELPYEEQRTITIMASRDGLPNPPIVRIAVAPDDVVEVTPLEVELRASKRRDDVATATLRVKAGRMSGVAMITAQIDSRSAESIIEVVEPETPPQPIPPATLEFERSRYRIVFNKTKTVKIRAPLGAYADGTEVRVSSDHKGIVVLDGGNVPLQSNPGRLAMEGAVRVQGRIDGSIGRLFLTNHRHQAQATVEVVRREDGGSDFDTKLVPEHQGDQRAQWSSDYRILRIMGEHPAVNPLLGSAQDNYPGQNSTPFRVLLAELVTDAVVRRILMQKYQNDEIDTGTFYVEHYRLSGRFLARAHRIVGSGGDVA